MRRTAFAVAILLAACGKHQAEPRPASQPSVAGTRPSIPVESARAMLGTWELSPPVGIRSPFLTLVVDSVRGSAFSGRLTRALSGDMELDVDRYQRLKGTLGRDSVARVQIPHREPGAPVTELVGKVTGGTWTLTSFIWGGEEQVARGRAWQATRGRGR